MENFYSCSLRSQVQQINKTRARNLYNNGETIYLMPCNMMFDNFWQQPYPLDKSRAMYHENFDRAVNSFAYYNCDNERGAYPRFYVKC